MPPLTKFLVETSARWRLEIGPVIEKVAAQLFYNAEKKPKKKLPTPLTESQRSAGRAKYLRRYVTVSEVD